MTNTQRWAAVGTGTISRSVVPDLQSCAGATVVSVHSRDRSKASRFAEEFGIPAATNDYDALLADPEIDAIYLATPFATHHTMTRQALIAGKHVLVEKPIAMNAAQAADLFELAAERGRFLMEGMWMKFSPAFRQLREEIAAGTIGEPRTLLGGFGIPFPDDGGSKWDVTRSGGALLDQGIYPLTLAHSIFGPPSSIAASGTVRSDGLDVSERITLEYSNGCSVQASVSMAEFTDCSASVGGTGGWLTLTAPFWATTTLEIHAGSAEKIFGTPDVVAHPREGHGYVPMLRAVIDALDAGLIEHPAHPAQDTVAVFEVMDAVLTRLRDAAGTAQ